MHPKKTPERDLPQTNWIIVLLVLLGVAVALLPVVLHLPAPTGRGYGMVFVYLPALVAVGACYALDRTFIKREKAEALFFCVVFAFLTTYLHIWLVDLGQYFREFNNLDWQIYLHDAVVNLRADAAPDKIRTIPDVYRFLPNSLVRLLEQITGDFSTARDGYRNLFGVLLFYSLYRFARLFLRHGGSLFCLALWTAVFPVSFRYYAGQLTDPLSHLSFILAFIFIETEQFVYLLLTLMIGCLAKESVVAMAGYYGFFRWREKSYVVKTILLVLAPVAVCAIARVCVLHDAPNYEQISGVPPGHVVDNWNDYSRWFPGLLYTVGIFSPFIFINWRNSPWSLRSLALYLFPVLFVSSLVFSWLREARNFMPLVAILTVLTVYHLVPGERAESARNEIGRESGGRVRTTRLSAKKPR
jgi:hypothetical protein